MSENNNQAQAQEITLTLTPEEQQAQNDQLLADLEEKKRCCANRD